MQLTNFSGVLVRSASMVTTVLVAGAVTAATNNHDHKAPRAIDHAPIGVMGDHLHKKGEFMLSYRAMHMQMQGNRDGTSGASAEEIVTTVPNPFAGRPMQPPTLRVVPTEMTMTMHMLGLMYAPSDRITLMAMTSVIEKEMDHLTFRGAMGTDRLGEFSTDTSGIGDTRISALTRLGRWDNGGQLHSHFGISIPTGDIKQSDRILTPMGTQPEPRLPYPMQIGSGSWDILAGLTYVRSVERHSFGGQWLGTFRVENNSEGYRLGDEHRFTGWYARSLTPALSLSARLQAAHRNKIDGADARVVAPVQTADPGNQGGTVIEAGIGANLLLLQRHRVGVEVVLPLHRDLNGPQLETDWAVTLGYQLAF